jgi:acetolactate synthase-1/2/3 large subunit
MLGMHGTYEANWAMNKADLIIALGSRFDDRVTGRLDAFAPNSRKVHIDIDRSSVNKNVRVDLPIIADVGIALREMIAAGRRASIPSPTSPNGGPDQRLARRPAASISRTSQT